MITRKTQILFKAESVANGTWDAPAVSQGVLAYDVIATPEFNMFKRNPYTSDMSRYESISGLQSATITFKTELRGDGSTVDAPTNIAVLLTACNFQLSGSSYVPKSTSVTTLSMQIEEDGVHKTFVGCAGNVRIVGTVGEPVFLEFTFRGTIRDITAGDLSTLTGIPTSQPPVLLNASFSTNVSSAVSHLINTIEFDMQNEVVLSPDISSTTGVRAAKITARNPIGSMDPEYSTSYDWLAQIIGNTEGTLTLEIGSAVTNRIRITCPQIRFLAMDPLDRDGIRCLTVPFEMNRSSGDDEIMLDWGFLILESGIVYDSVTIAEGVTVDAPA